MDTIDYIDLRKISGDGLRQIRRQVVRLKKMGKSGKEIELLVGIRQNRISEIWTAYQRDAEAALNPRKNRRKPGKPMLLSQEEQNEIQRILTFTTPQEFGLKGHVWTQGRTVEWIRQTYHKEIAIRTLSSYMARWGLRRLAQNRQNRQPASKAQPPE